MDIKRYVPQNWILERLQTYDLVRKLRKDAALRAKWVQAEARSRKKDDPTIDADELANTMDAYLQIVEFDVRKTRAGKLAVHVRPKRFKGKSFSEILGVDTENLAASFKRLTESAVQDVIRGYGKASVLTGIFGTEFRGTFNQHLKHRMEDEFGK